MTWTRLNDGWTDSQEVSTLSLPARWHYLAMIQWCSKNALYDGEIRSTDARRCSDVDDPTAALAELVSSGVIASTSAGYTLNHIDQHIPPPSVREASDKAKIRMRRMRLHRNGDHSSCLAESCDRSPVTHDVTRNTRTGQDGSGHGNYPQADKTKNAGQDLAQPGDVGPHLGFSSGSVTRNTSATNGATQDRSVDPGQRCDRCPTVGPTRVDGMGNRLCPACAR